MENIRMSDETATNEVVINSGRRIAMGSEWWEIRDAGAHCHFVDIVTEARQFNGIVSLTLGAALIDANNEGICDIVSRLRMSLGTAQQLHQLLGGMISEAFKPIDASKAN
jgi:hypothetical protein